MTVAISQLRLLVAKDLRIELRNKQVASVVLMLGILIVVVLGMGLGGGGGAGGGPVSGFQATAILWVAYLFAGVLCFEKTMEVDRRDDALAALLLAPVDRGVLYLSKLLTNIILLGLLALIITPAAIALFRFDLSTHFAGFVLIMTLSLIGFAAVGTLFAAATSGGGAGSRVQGGLLAMLVFPLCLPIVIASTQTMRRLFEEGGGLSLAGLSILVAFVLIFITVGWLVFELVLEP